jgi:ribonuclease HI
MNKLTPSDQCWASEEVGGLALDHAKTLLHVAVLRTAHRTSLSNANDLASLSAQARLKNDNYLKFIEAPSFCSPPNEELLEINPIHYSYYARVAKAADFLNVHIQCNHNISPLSCEYIRHEHIADKLKIFNVNINEMIINDQLTSYNKLHRLAPNITTVDYAAIKEDLPNITRRVCQKLKGKAPFPLSPQNLSPATCTIWGDNVPIWTDGSTCTNHELNKTTHGWGVFFKKDSGLNTWRRTNLEFDITSAELMAIEHALSIAPLTPHTTIFSDSLNAVSYIADSPGWNHATWNRCLYASNLHRISNLIKHRAELGNQVHIHHIYSHIEHKRRTWPKHKLCLLDNQEKHLNSLFQNRYKDIKEGNDQADLLAAKAVLTSKFRYPPPPNPVKYTLMDKSSGRQVPNIGAQGRRVQAQTWNTILLNRTGPTLGCYTTAKTATESINKTRFWIKLRNLALATKALTHKYNKHKGINTPMICPNPDCTYCELSSPITPHRGPQPPDDCGHPYLPSSPNCPFCNLNVPETTIHCIGECPAWSHIRHQLQKDIEAHCTAVNIPPPHNLLLTEDHAYTALLNQPKMPLHDWELYPQLSASLGLIPIGTLNEYGNLLSLKEIHKLNHDLTAIIITKQHELYTERNKQFQDLYNR